jgi:methylated-DNA-protein-cysteine methyltransferase related protein
VAKITQGRVGLTATNQSRRRIRRSGSEAPRSPVVSPYQRIYALVRRIPRGQLATYGQIAQLIDGCTARMVGYALAALPHGKDVPWHRVINSLGTISLRKAGDGALEQRFLLEKEGIRFNRAGKVDLASVRWAPDNRKGKVEGNPAQGAATIRKRAPSKVAR